MFHLRRSQFLQVFNNSPDETSYYRYVDYICIFVTHCLLSVVCCRHNLCNQFESRSGLTDLLETLIILLKEFFEKVDFKKNQQTTKKHGNYPGGKEFKDPVSATYIKAHEILVLTHG